jgi:trehalose 6-phosphate synthase/phosphatase
MQVDMSPTAEVKRLLQRLADDHIFYIVSGRVKWEMMEWFADVPAIGIASEHGYHRKAPGSTAFVNQYPGLDFSWKEIVRPIMTMYADSTDGSYVQEKDCGLTWAYAAADPDFGRWQVRFRSLSSLIICHPV